MSAPVIDLVGVRFGFLLVIGRSETPGDSSRLIWYDCECRCGARVSVRSDYLRNHTRRKCGRDCSYAGADILVVSKIIPSRY